MRIVFMGTPDFAVPSLEALIDGGHEVTAVYCQPDRPKGRGQRLVAPPVKETALARGIPVYQPSSLRGEDVQARLFSQKPDCIIVVAYGKMLPKGILALPRRGCINVHGSLLPKYRGAAPIQWAVIRGERVTGVSTMYMAEKMDAGDLLLQKEVTVLPGETAGELFDRLKTAGAALLIKTLDRLDRLTPIPQDETQVSFAPMLKKEDGAVDWSRPAQEIHHLICGMNPWPGAYTVFQGKKLKLLRSEPVSKREASAETGSDEAPLQETEGGKGGPGRLENRSGELVVCCGRGALRLLEVQPENKKRMTGRSFLLGHPLKSGDAFRKPEV